MKDFITFKIIYKEVVDDPEQYKAHLNELEMK